jgi:streptogramin lyase
MTGAARAAAVRTARVLVLVLACGLTACGGAGGSHGPRVASPATPVALGSGLVTLTVQVPPPSAQSNRRSPRYVSTAIASIVFVLTAVAPTGGGTFTGPLNTATVMPVTYNSGNCTFTTVETCTLSFTAPAPATDTWTAYSYATATPTVGVTTPLSIYPGVSLAVTLAGPNTVAVSSYGVPFTLAFSPSQVYTASDVALSGATALTTTLQAKDRAGVALTGAQNFASSTGTVGAVNFTGCSATLTPTPTSTSWPTPATLGSGAVSIAYSGTGTPGTTLYCNATAPGSLTAQYAITLLTPGFTEVATATGSSTPRGITVGPDGNLWFTESGANKIAQITITGGVSTASEYAVTTASSGPLQIVTGPDGDLWFTENSGNNVGEVTTLGVVTEYKPATTGSAPFGITVGSDSNLWFTEAGKTIGRVTTAGIISEYPVLTAGSNPFGITSGPDGNLWIAEYSGNKIGKMSTAGVLVAEYPAFSGGGSNPWGITTGPDGNIWYTEYGVGRIGKMTTTGTLGNDYPVPSGAGSQPSTIVAAPDGNLWFTEYSGSKIGRITTAGVVTEYGPPTGSSGPYGITVGPDGSLWFTEGTASKIGRYVR